MTTPFSLLARWWVRNAGLIACKITLAMPNGAFVFVGFQNGKPEVQDHVAATAPENSHFEETKS